VHAGVGEPRDDDGVAAEIDDPLADPARPQMPAEEPTGTIGPSPTATTSITVERWSDVATLPLTSAMSVSRDGAPTTSACPANPQVRRQKSVHADFRDGHARSEDTAARGTAQRQTQAARRVLAVWTLVNAVMPHA
jgi:hypothetical protein